MFTIKTMNAISPVGLAKLPATQFEIDNDAAAPQGILVRSADLHEAPLPDSLLAIARAGAGTNNIPLDKCTEAGIVVFNTPGANANAVAELVIGALVAGSRNMPAAIRWAEGLKGSATLAKDVEKGKKQFVGPELRGKTLPPARTDQLFGLMTTEALWSSHPAGSIGWEYLGCHYLLAKDLPGFRAFIEASGARELPRHFQEAWLIANDTPDSSALHPAIRPEIARRYEQLRELLSIRSASDVDMRAVYQTFGDTYWFYYYFKIFQDPTNTNAR